MSGTTKIEGGTVVKFAGGTAPTIYIPGTVDCQTGPYRLAIFTAQDDDSVGEMIAGSSHTPAGKYGSGLMLGTSGGTLKHLRFCHAHSALGLNFSSGQVDLAHLQVLNCLYGVDFNGNSENTVNVDNCLFSSITNVTTSGYDNILRGRHLTVDDCPVLFAIGSGNHNGEVYLTNSVLANVVELGDADVYGGSHNGFFNCPTFGSAIQPPPPAGASPFQTVGAASHYLTTDPAFRGKGTTGIAAALLDSLKTKTTQPPITFPRFMYVTGELTLFPQVPRYVSGNPDLGYHYDVLDYTMAALLLDGGTINVQPGTAIGFRQEYAPEYWWGLWPFDYTEVGINLLRNSTIISHGTPSRPNVFADVQLVQEAVEFPVAILFLADRWLYFARDNPDTAPPVMDFRFSNLYTSTSTYLRQFQFLSGDLWTYSPAVNMSLRDCNLFGGWIRLGRDFSDSTFLQPQCGVQWVNNLFDHVTLTMQPDWFEPPWYDPTLFVDLAVEVRNNLFRHGCLRLFSIPATAGNWVCKDNLFDKVDFFQDTNAPLDYDYNAYWPLTQAELDEHRSHYPWDTPNFGHWQVTTPMGDLNGGNEPTLTAGPVFQNGPLGDCYLPTSSPLYNSDKRGSRTVAEAGLYHYTTRTDQAKDGAQTGNVIIGRHYVATASASSTQPKDSDTPAPDGIPDYVENWHGDGDTGVNRVHTNDETDWNNPTTDTDPNTSLPIADSLNPKYDDADLDGDGMLGFLEKRWNKLPLTGDNPLSLAGAASSVQVVGDWTAKLQISSQLDSTEPFLLFVNGSEAETGGVMKNQADEWWASLDSSTLPNNDHVFQAAYAYNSPSPDIGSININHLAFGPLIIGKVQNPITFDRINDEFSQVLYVRGTLNVPASAYTVKIYDKSSALLATLNGNPVGDRIEDSWDFTTAQINVDDGLDAQIELTGSFPGPQPLVFPKRYYLVMPYGPSFGAFTLAWGWDKATPSQFEARGTAVRMGLVDMLGFDLNDQEFDLLPNGSGGNIPFTSSFRLEATQASRDRLLNAIAQPSSRNFFFWGHGAKNRFAANPEVPIYIAAWDIAHALGNPSQGDYTWKYSNPYHFVFMDSCSAYSKEMVRAFGIPFSARGSESTMADYIQFNKPLGAFIGWDHTITSSAITCQQCDLDRVYAHAIVLSYWKAGFSVWNAMNAWDAFLMEEVLPPGRTWPVETAPDMTYKEEKLKYPQFSPVGSWKISGCKDLTRYNGQAP